MVCRHDRYWISGTEFHEMKFDFGDIIFWLIMVGVVVIFIMDAPNAVYLTKGLVGAGVDLSSGIANLGQPVAQKVNQ